MRLTPSDKANLLAADCAQWMREMRQVADKTTLDKMMTYVRTQQKPRTIPTAIMDHFESIHREVASEFAIAGHETPMPVRGKAAAAGAD